MMPSRCFMVVVALLAVLTISLLMSEAFHGVGFRSKDMREAAIHASATAFSSSSSSKEADVPSCFRPNPLLRPRTNMSGSLPLSKPILNVGFPKMGSTTLHKFFQCGRYRSSHYMGCPSKRAPCGVCLYQAVMDGKPPLQTCGNFDVYAEMNWVRPQVPPCFWPQIHLLRHFHAEAPNATFVLIFRDLDAWISSLSRHRLEDGKNYIHGLVANCGLLATDSKEAMKALFCEQVTRIRSFVKLHPSHTLVEVELEDEATPDILSNLFHVNASCWGHANVNKHRLQNTTANNSTPPL